MHTNIETTFEQFLAGVVEDGIVRDLEPLQTLVISVEQQPATTTPTIIVSVNPALDDCQEETLRTDGETPTLA